MAVTDYIANDFSEEGSEFAGHITVNPEPAGLAAIRRQILRVARNLQIPDDEVMGLVIAVGEAVSNAYLHGTPDRDSGCIAVDWRYSNRMLTVTVRDTGCGFSKVDCDKRTSPSIPTSGCGILLMCEGVDDVNFEHDGGGKVVLKKYLTSDTSF